MDIGLKSARAVMALGLLSVALSACQQDGSTGPSAAANEKIATQASVNGAAGQMPAYYDGELFTVNMKEHAGRRNPR